MIAPTRVAGDELLRELTRARGAIFGVQCHTLGGLAARLAAPELSRSGTAPATRLAAEALAARAVSSALEEGALDYLVPVARTPSFARAVLATLSELRQERVGGASLGELGPGARDVAELLRRFELELERGRLVDRAALFALAAGAAAGVSSLGPTILLDLPVRDEAEARLVAAIARQSPRVLATVPAGDLRTARALGAMGANVATIDAAGEGSLARLQRHVFASGEVPRGERGEEVELFSAPGEGRECVEIARRIQAEARRGVPFDRMAVALRVPATYAVLLEGALARAGVPAWFERGTSRPHPGGRALSLLLACRAEGLSARRFAEYLSLGQVPALGPDGAPPGETPQWIAPRDDELGIAGDGEGAEPGGEAPPLDGPASRGSSEGTLPAPFRWEELLVEASVLGGRERWARRLLGLDAELGVKIAMALREDPSSPRIAPLERDRAALGHLRRFALPIIDALSALPVSADWGVWLAALGGLVPRALRRPEAVLEVLAELAPMSGVGPVTLDEVRAVLGERLTSLTLAPARRRYGRVFVATPADLRGLAFDVVFVPGLAERLFPSPPREDPLLLDARRRRVSERLAGAARLAQPALRTQPERAEEERLLLRLAVGAASKRVVVSYPRVTVGEETRARVPSFYALDVVRAVEGEVPSFAELERAAASASDARLAWPAPPAPETAIDDAEHDLSILGRLLRPGERDVVGRAAYLLRLNEHLGRSLRSRWKRWKREWSRFDGIVAPTPAVSSALARHRLGTRPYSISALQHYAACPYRFFLSAIVGLAPRGELVGAERLDPATRGTLFHRVVAEVQRELERQGLRVTQGSLASAEAVLKATLGRVAGELEEKLLPPIRRVWDDELESVFVDALGLLHRMADESETWEPHRAEWGFGLARAEGADPRSAPDPAILFERFKLCGQIDAIDRHRASGALRVTDYKTGVVAAGPFLMIGGGEALQPVLYALAVEALLRQEVAEGRLFHCTAKGGFAERVVPLDPTSRLRGREVLEVVDRAIERAFLPPLPKAGACARCAFRAVCGPEEETRSARKDHKKTGEPGVVDDLFALRRMP